MSTQLMKVIEALALSERTQVAATYLLNDIEGAVDSGELDRSTIFANGFTLGLDQGQVDSDAVLGLQVVYQDAHDARRSDVSGKS